MSDDLSPNNLPLTSALAAIRRSGSVDHAAAVDAVSEVAGYVFLAKCTLLEHRIRDFTAADVVALTRIFVEARERAARAK